MCNALYMTSTKPGLLSIRPKIAEWQGVAILAKRHQCAVLASEPNDKALPDDVANRALPPSRGKALTYSSEPCNW